MVLKLWKEAAVTPTLLNWPHREGPVWSWGGEGGYSDAFASQSNKDIGDYNAVISSSPSNLLQIGSVSNYSSASSSSTNAWLVSRGRDNRVLGGGNSSGDSSTESSASTTGMGCQQELQEDKNYHWKLEVRLLAMVK